MNVARLNFSHGTHEEHSETIHRIREISDHTKSHTAILQDLSGPKIRLGEFPAGAVKIERGNEFILTGRQVAGDEHIASVTYRNLPEEVKSGDVILLSDVTSYIAKGCSFNASMTLSSVSTGPLFKYLSLRP